MVAALWGYSKSDDNNRGNLFRASLMPGTIISIVITEFNTYKIMRWILLLATFHRSAH